MELLNRREFLEWLALAGVAGGCRSFGDEASYSVSVLGDMHYDAAPDTVYHAEFKKLFDGTGRFANRYATFFRYATMWAGPSRRILEASGKCVTADTRFCLQLGDLIQGDCHDFAVHRRMLADALSIVKGVYPTGLPFLSVCGNHDIRHGDVVNDDAAIRPYAEMMVPYTRGQLGKMACGVVDDTTFGFRCGPDFYLVINFNMGTRTIPAIKRLLDENRDVRYTFIVSHGGVFPYDFWCRWFYLGNARHDRERREMRALFAARNAIVLCAHTHDISLREAVFPEGVITEMTMNTVWGRTPNAENGMSAVNPARPERVRAGVESYGNDSQWLDAEPGRRELIAEYKPYMTRHWHADGVGHAKMRVSDSGVWFDYYGHDALLPTKTFHLR